jgi:hypothetical protein
MDALENTSSTALLSCECVRDSLKTSEQIVGDTNKPHKSSPKRLSKVFHFRATSNGIGSP